MADDLEQLWRATLGDTAFEGVDPRATCRPPEGEETLTLDPERNDTMATLAPWVANATLAPVGRDTGPEERGDYEVGAELGQGGMAVVHRARQARLRRDVALKMAHDGAGPRARRRFVAEAQVTGALDHPNIVPVYDLVEAAGGRLALAMKLVGGRPWSRVLAERTRGVAEHVAILVDVCHAIEFAHARGFVHADLKPENVMLGEFGEVVVMDWGCAVAIGPADPSGPAVRRSEEVTLPFGTPAYMPPELARGDGALIGARTDVYLLGAILYDVLAGRPPHLQGSLRETLAAAAASAPPPMPEGAPAALAAIARRAMAAQPDDRYASVAALREALDQWLETRKSLILAEDARQLLDRCARVVPGAQTRSDLYVDLEAALAGFTQARRLWPENQDAITGEHAARELVVDTALRFGDIGLAEAHASRTEGRVRDGMMQRVAAARAAQDDALAAGQRVRYAIVAALVAVFVVGGSGLVAVNAARGEAVGALALADQRLAEIRRLSDVQLVEQRVAEAETLWPAVPTKAPAMRDWLASAGPLVARLPAHREKLAELRAGVAPVRGQYVFADAALQWEHDTLARLVIGLEALEAAAIPGMQARAALAETVQQRSIDDHRAAWDRAIAEVAASPAYGGLTLAPQLGLVPLGADPESGLQEFAHLASGALPERGPGGRIAPSEGMGIVLVLLPGGTFTMGARREPGPNHDPAAKEVEGPPHAVTLGPFFMGKYEVTQDQWQRAAGANPSAAQPGGTIAGRVTTSLHPVEQIGWRDSEEVLRKLALALPTEARWEYASRGGTSTVYWTGDDVASLQGAVNIADLYGKTNGGPESWLYEERLDDGYLSHAPIGTYRANPFGLHDTAGNVWEWCLDQMGAYTLPVAPDSGARLAPAEAPHLFRGGGYRANRAHARSADRYPLASSDHKGFDIGLRAARSLDPAAAP